MTEDTAFRVRIAKGPCPHCDSSDAYETYADGHSKCYSCGKFDKPKERKSMDDQLTTTRGDNPSAARDRASGPQPVVKPPKADISKLPTEFIGIKDRGLKPEAVARFQTFVSDDSSERVSHRYPYFVRGKHVGNKNRQRNVKKFWTEGNVAQADLFGQQAFPAGCHSTITITEGEVDAMSVYQMNGCRFPVVSLTQGVDNAVNDIKRNFEYINSFDEVVICLDTDTAKKNKKTGEIRYPGQETALKIAEMLPVGKVRLLTLRDHKDPNEYLLAGHQKKFISEWFDAPKFTPAALRSGKDLWDEISYVPEYETVSYPFEGIEAKTYGMRLSEMVIVNAQQKIGKSTLLGELTYHLLRNTEAGIGIMRLEETNRDTALNLMSIHASKRLHLPDVWEALEEGELRKYYDETVNTDRLVIWDHFGSNSIDAILAQVRNMHALGCKYIILDHLSIVVSDQSGDERKQLDELATKLKTLCMELNICLLAVVHQNREGQIRGTAGIGQLANIVLRLDRDKEHRDSFVRNCTQVTVTDNRFCGDTGLACYLYYNPDTGRMEHLTEDEFVQRQSSGPVPNYNDEGWEDLVEDVSETKE
jgi:twinkle protein